MRSVDVELVALWVFHRYSAVIDALLGRDADHGTFPRELLIAAMMQNGCPAGSA